MELYFFYNSHSQISANNFVGKDLSEETLKDFLKSIKMLNPALSKSCLRLYCGLKLTSQLTIK